MPNSSQQEGEDLGNDEAGDGENLDEDEEDDNDPGNGGEGEDDDGSGEEAEDEDQGEGTEDENEDDSRDKNKDGGDENGGDENENGGGACASNTDIVPISFWDHISEDSAHRLMTTGVYISTMVVHFANHAIGLSLDKSDLSLLRQYALKVEDHLTESTFAKFKFAFPESYHHSLKKTKLHIKLLSKFQPVRYSCCINSCVCFTGPYNDLAQCPNCKED
jgi:cobalamin biosynthesis protein CobT